MFSFFRINDPYRLIIISFILIFISLPVLIGGRPLTIPELTWMIVGEKMSEGASLYIDIWDSVSPFAAAVYWFIDALFGRSLPVYQIIGLMLIIVQSAIFNSMLLKFKAYNENNYIPALIYALLMTMHFDFLTLSPALMSLTFLLPALRLVFDFIQSREKDDEKILRIGIYSGVAVLFFFPAILFMIVVILAFLFFTGVSARKSLLAIYGFVLPIALVGAYYYFKGGDKAFLIQYIYAYFMFPEEYLVDFSSLLAIASTTILFGALSILKVFSYPGFTNFQTRIQQIMLTLVIVSAFMFSMTNNKAPFQLAIFAPPAAFFISHHFMLIRRRLFVEIQFTIFLFLIVFINLGSYYNIGVVNRFVDPDGLFVGETSIGRMVAGSKILVLGDEVSYYKDAQLATPYLDWEVAGMHFHALDYYDNITAIYQNLQNDMPDYIIDQEGLMHALEERIPAIDNWFVETTTEKVYRRRSRE